jgi:hypothetical protein
MPKRYHVDFGNNVFIIYTPYKLVRCIFKMNYDNYIELEHSVETTCVKFNSLSDKLVKDGKTAILTISKWDLIT